MTTPAPDGDSSERRSPESPTEAPGGIGDLWTRIRLALTGRLRSGTLARGAALAFFVTAAGMGVGFVLQAVLTRTLGPEGYGLYAYVLGWVNVVALAAKFEFDTAALRFLGEYSGNRSWSAVRAYLRFTRRVVGTSSLGLAAFAVVVLWLLRDRLTPTQFMAGLAAATLLPPMANLMVLAGSLQGLKRVVAAQVPPLLVRPLVFGGTFVAAVFLFGANRSAATAIVANGIGCLIALLVATRLIQRTLPADGERAAAPVRRQVWVRTASALFVISVMQLILSTQTDVVVVGSLLDSVSAGQYAIATQLTGLAGVGVSAVLFVATPLIADYHHNRPREDLQHLLTAVGRFNLLVAVPVIVGLVVFGKPVLRIFGPTFVGAYPILLVSCVTAFTGALAGSVAGFVMTMTNRQVQGAWIIGFSSAVYAVTVYPLTARYGAVGTALATLIAFSIRAVILTVYIRITLRLSIIPLR